MQYTPLFALLLFVGCAAPAGGERNSGVTAGAVADFEIRNDFLVDVPAHTSRLDVWFAVPNDNDSMQDVSGWVVEPNDLPTKLVRDRLGNPFLHLHLEQPEAGPIEVGTRFTITRSETKADLDPNHTRPHTAEELAELALYLRGSSHSIIDGNAIQMARNVVGHEKNPIVASRLIFAAILNHVEHDAKDPKPDAVKTMQPTGTGNSQLCYSTCTGDSADFHSLYCAVSRAAGIPTRVVYGSLLKGPLDGVDQDQGYHCWAEFHAPQIGWVPIDVASADLFVGNFVANEHSRPRVHLTVANGYTGSDAALVDYYFGNLDERRVSWHWGRDLEMTAPRQNGAALPSNPQAYAEVNGRPANIVRRKLTYSQLD